jgi:hypothetical protein
MRTAYAENDTFDGLFCARPTSLIGEAYQPIGSGRRQCKLLALHRRHA